MNINKQLVFSLRSLISLISIIVMITIILVAIIPQLLSLLDSSDQTRIDSIISFLGNLVGGLIAAVVAYIVAKYQMKKVEEQSNLKIQRTSYIELKFVEQELLYNHNVIDSTIQKASLKEQILFLKENLKDTHLIDPDTNFVYFIEDIELKSILNYYEQIKFIREKPSAIKKEHIKKFETSNHNLLKLIKSTIKKINLLS